MPPLSRQPVHPCIASLQAEIAALNQRKPDLIKKRAELGTAVGEFIVATIAKAMHSGILDDQVSSVYPDRIVVTVLWEEGGCGLRVNGRNVTGVDVNRVKSLLPVPSVRSLTNFLTDVLCHDAALQFIKTCTAIARPSFLKNKFGTTVFGCEVNII